VLLKPRDEKAEQFQQGWQDTLSASLLLSGPLMRVRPGMFPVSWQFKQYHGPGNIS
jgi:hypothetical protein